MEYNIEVENIRCGGCSNTITKKLKEINGVEDVQVNVEEKQVVITTGSAAEDNVRQQLSKQLLKLGYPEVGAEGSNNLKAKATSVVSCAIGKVSSKS